MPRHSIVSLRLTTKEKTDGSFACNLASRWALYSLSDFDGSQRMKRATAGVMHTNTSSASAIVNGLSCSLADRIKTCIMLALPNILVYGRGRCVGCSAAEKLAHSAHCIEIKEAQIVVIKIS